MEKNPVRTFLYNSSAWRILGYIFQHPESQIQGSLLVRALPQISKSSLYSTLQQLVKAGVLTAVDVTTYELNQNLAWVRQMMIADSLMMLQPLVDRLSKISSKIILFGSRANGDYTSDSDYDLLVISSSPDVRKIIAKSSLEEKIQLILKTPEEWIDLHKTGPELYASVQKGIVLWERK
jgi:predicted nucleotidyltransferase